MSRIVLHIDMDAFFASVEERDKPRLKGQPIVVGADPAGGHGRGVVSTANYAARKYGIKSAMPISRAWDLSQQAKKAGQPEVVFMEPDFRRYTEASHAVFGYIASLGGSFELGGIDEGYLEMINDGMTNDEIWEKAKDVAARIKQWVKTNQQLTCSIGIGPNKLIAKMAAGRQKPDGLTIIRLDQVQDFLDPLSVRELMGVGPKTEQRLNELDIHSIAQLRAKSQEQMVQWFGKHGAGLYRQARGIDDSPVESAGEQKSIGEQMTFDKDTLDPMIIIKVFEKIIGSVGNRVKVLGVRFKTISIIIRFANFITKTRTYTLDQATNSLESLKIESLKLLLPFLDSRENPKRLKLRLIGVRVEKLE